MQREISLGKTGHLHGCGAVQPQSRAAQVFLVAKAAPRNDNGQALVEFALVISVLVFILMGVFDLGRGIYAYNVVASAAREGAHYGILNPTDTPGIQTQAMANTAALDQSQITVTPVCSPDCNAGSSMGVTVTYRFVPVTAFFATLNVTGKATMTIE